MQYLNPFLVFNLQPSEYDTQWEKTKLEAQNYLQPYQLASSVQFNGFSITKKVAQELLLEMEDANKRQYHAWILGNKPLYNFIEYGHTGFFQNLRNSEHYQNPDFVQFIAPYFSYQYSEAMLQAIKSQDQETIDLLSKNPLQLDEQWAEQCFLPSVDYVASTANGLQSLQSQQDLPYISERELLSHLPDQTIELYNRLPDYFSEARNVIGNEVGNLAMFMTQQLGRLDGAEAILRQGLKLKLDDTLRSNLEQLLSGYKVSVRNSGMPKWFIVGGIAIALLFLLKYLETNFF